jgi:lysophospholipase L1-like esterase
MKTLVQKYSIIVALLCLTAGCDSDISGSFGEDPDPGSADFSTFVALGDSFTAGYSDSALYRHGQQNSFPAIMAQQFTTVGGGEFDQPLMDTGKTGSLTLSTVNLGRSDRLVLAPNPVPDPDRPAVPQAIDPTDTTAIDVRLPGAGMYNNIGVPGAKSFHAVTPNYGELTIAAVAGMTANPYFARFASSNTVTMIDDAQAQVPSFFVLWIGNFDILFYATAGAPGTANPPYGTGSTDVTDPAVFTPAYQTLVASLKTPTNKGVLVNIPDVSTISYFTTVPFDAIPMDAATAALSNAAYAAYNGALVAAEAAMTISPEELAQRTITFVEGQNALVIEDESLTILGGGIPNIRQAMAKDLVVLPASPRIGTESVMGNPATVWGVGTALLDGDVVTEYEFGLIETARTAYNATIVAETDANPDLLLFDAEAFFTELNTTGILYGSGGISSAFGQGGGISLDGVHPTARGYAVIANEMFKVINAGFGGYIPPVDPSDYTTVFYQ